VKASVENASPIVSMVFLSVSCAHCLLRCCLRLITARLAQNDLVALGAENGTVRAGAKRG
jgi:hypothetical protein